MKYKNRYLYYSILPCCLLLIVIGFYAFGYNPPTQNPPFGNLPAPINAGPDPQTKAGNLTIQGNLTTGGFTMSAGAGANKVLTTNASGVATWQEAAGGWDGVLPSYTTSQRNALSLVDGLIVFNTSDNAVQIYVSGIWRNVGGKLSSGVLCSLDGDCDSTHCIDGVCCATTCEGNCNRCNVAGSEGTCTDTNLDCTGNCDICSSGNCVASVGLCTGNCDQCTGSGTNYSCSANVDLCTGNCDECTGSGTVFNCSANAVFCTGNCDVCSGSGTAYNCAASNALCSNTAASCNCSGSGTVFNCQSCPDTYGVCGEPTCSSYVCGNNTASYNNVQCSTCKKCSSGSCINVPAGTSGYGCTTTHYRCDGSGGCTAPTTQATVNAYGCCPSGNQWCAKKGHDGCLYMGPDYTYKCSNNFSCSHITEYACVTCWNWVYD